MLARDIITTAATYLQQKLPEACYDSSYTARLNTELANNSTLKHLMLCLDNVLSEIACDYIPNIKRATVQAKDGIIDTSQLTGTVLEVLRLTDDSGNNIVYRYVVGGLLVQCQGQMQLLYSTTFGQVKYLDSINLPVGKVDCRVLAYGVASEYCLMMGDYDTMTMWDARFRNSLMSLNKKTPVYMPNNRRWI